MYEAYLVAANRKNLPIFQRMKFIRGSYIYRGGGKKGYERLFILYLGVMKEPLFCGDEGEEWDEECRLLKSGGGKDRFRGGTC